MPPNPPRVGDVLAQMREVQRTVAAISARFAGDLPLDAAISATLEDLGRLSGAGRAYLFQLRPCDTLFDNTHEWCAAGVIPQRDQLIGMPVSVYPWWVGRLREREIIHVTDVAEIPPEGAAERAILEMQDIKSVLVLPMHAGARLVGFIGLDDVVGTRTWEHTDLELLTVVTEILVHAFARDAAQGERKRLATELQHVRHLEALGRLAGGVAHDFNNLMGAMLSFTSLAADHLPDGHPARADLADALDVGQRARALVSQLLRFGAVEPGAPRLTDLNELIAPSKQLLGRLLGDRVTLQLDLASSLLPVDIDATRLQQVLLSLVLNARDAMPDGGTLTITTALEPGVPAWLRLTVQDTGVGMTPEVVGRIFEPFFTTKAPGAGSGLGLALCHAHVTEAGGRLAVESDPERGTTFTVRLPAGVAAEAVAAHPTLPGCGSTILVVDDEPDMRRAVVRILERAGHVVLEAEHADAAIRTYAQHPGPIALLLTDVVMPGRSGPELAAQLVTEHPALTVRYMTGYPRDAFAHLAIDAGRVISKPFLPAELKTFVAAALDGSLADQEVMV